MERDRTTDGSDREDGSATLLSEEHRRVIQMIAKGWTDQRMADVLGVSSGTVWRRVKEAMTHLQARSRPQLIVRAIEQGLLHVEVPPGQGSGSHEFSARQGRAKS